MAQVNLPLSRAIDVAITRQTVFPTEEGFGTLLIVADEDPDTNPTAVDADTRTKLYADMTEVALDWTSGQEAYKAAQTAFAQEPSPLFIKIGYREAANKVTDELDLIQAFDQDWYGLCFTKEMRDHYQTLATDDVIEVADWIEARTKLYMTATNDALTEELANQTHIAYLTSFAGYDRTGTFYHTDTDLYPDVAFFARGLRTNFNGDDSTITMKFKRLKGITPIQRSSAKVTTITAFVPGTGQQTNSGHYANTYVTLGGQDIVVEGNMASGEWFDTMHFVDWLQHRIEIRVYALLVKMPKVPYTNEGVQLLVDEVGYALQEGVDNGGIAEGDLTDDLEPVPPYTIIVDRVSTVPISQRAQRISPTITFSARLAGAIHYVVINGNVTV